MHVLPDVVIKVEDAADLTGFTASDATALATAVEDSEIRRWLPLPDPYPYPVALAEEWSTNVTESIRTSGAGLVRCIRVDGALAGCIDVKRINWRARTAEIGYWLKLSYRGCGHASAAVDARAKWLLVERSFERVELRIATGNRASAAVAVRAGFTFEGVARNAGFIHAGRVDLEIWSRIAGDSGCGPGAGPASRRERPAEPLRR
ncbi:GNAT family N-acetyltransferase [Curtobacterium sp. VKM Ac-2865]|uniref:GNAT family N-acetyltransferase n=1 Tax=Curtobacterium sp. VKM Ac-2865 TaxID=2783817 RepID=UPI00188AC821|nr:GNAT family protein [Curtobacterium sp. VKM Ac-2865]MBF4581673.1 GNAT family N-acetyltransferase [Curtobacterium sp. VKM Ac-2865]